ncbi:unnamed protein product [Mesocestoides corti]|uniref:Clip domain-containing protein n=1 Tax=Mesocestoides corti TaxID=53468 RepID=A0A0R3U616_MESCO|nr:unnamed protein product [Mesocestoides corti]
MRAPILLYLCVSLALGLPTDDDHVIQFGRLGNWGDYVPETTDCDRFPDALECENHALVRRKGGDCIYTVTLQSKIFPNEELKMCAQPRRPLPCRMTGDVRCVVPPMEMSKFDLMILYIINHELKARIIRLQNQQALGRTRSSELQREIELIIADNVAWMCSLKCDNSSCEFGAELEPHRRSVGGLPRMTSLVTEYPHFSRSAKVQNIRIDMPIGSFEIARLMRKMSPFRHMAVSSLPLTVSCLRHGG